MLTDRDRERYKRQLLAWTEDQQHRLKDARVLIAGAGGLGSPLAMYLAVAGVGHIRVVDRDAVDLSNLNRQTLHTEGDIGRLKTESAVEALRDLNRDIHVEGVTRIMDDGTIDELVDGHDIIVDCTDNFPVRYVLNRKAVRSGLPMVHGGIRGFLGQLTFIAPGKGPCLACIFKQAPEPESIPVFGATPGVIGALQATEVIKYLTGVGDLLIGRLLIYDGEAMEFQNIKIERDPGCVECRAK
ncbi:MAG: HesA/MoeB/ThiF family protein [Candidatus Riflebacteria bacterium]|nr:HesA/MoeB/ThiF family protein [Candidatus Riflebacteria bacterium]